MEAIGIIIGVVLTAAYIVAAVYTIKSRVTVGGTLCCTGIAIVLGVFFAIFIEYIVAICIVALFVSILVAFIN